MCNGGKDSLPCLAIIIAMHVTLNYHTITYTMALSLKQKWIGIWIGSG